MKIIAIALAFLSPLVAFAAPGDVQRSVDYKEFGHDYAMTMTVSKDGVSFLEREKVDGKNKTAQDKADLRAIKVDVQAEDIAGFEGAAAKFLEEAKTAQDAKPAAFNKSLGKVGLLEYKLDWDGSTAWMKGNGFLRTAEVERILTLLKQLPEAKAELAKQGTAAPAPAVTPK